MADLAIIMERCTSLGESPWSILSQRITNAGKLPKMTKGTMKRSDRIGWFGTKPKSCCEIPMPMYWKSSTGGLLYPSQFRLLTSSSCYAGTVGLNKGEERRSDSLRFAAENSWLTFLDSSSFSRRPMMVELQRSLERSRSHRPLSMRWSL